jgi:hypothetical protein
LIAKLRAYLRAVLLLLCGLLTVGPTRAGGQNNQAYPQKIYWAADYGTWQVKSAAPNTYQWQPSSLCQFPQPGGGFPFSAFNTNGPVYLQDANPANSEVLTPSFVLINETLCEVALTPTHNHYSFELMSGTAGLQEALNTISSQIAYATQVILDRNWYTLLSSVPGANATAVIGSVKGSSAAVLVDITQAPEVFYKWNGGQYIAQTSAGTPGGPAGGALGGSYPDPSLANGTSGLNNVLALAAGVTINDGGTHVPSNAGGSPFYAVNTLAELAALQINGKTPFSWITSSPFSNGGIYTLSIYFAGNSGTPGTFAISFSGGGCSVEPTGTFTVGNSGSITAVSLTTRGSGCTSQPTAGAYLSSGLLDAYIVPTFIGDSSVRQLDLAWLCLQAAEMTGKTYVPAGSYLVGTTMPLPIMIPNSSLATGILTGTPTMTKGDGYLVTQIVAGYDWGLQTPLLSAGDPAGTASNTLTGSRYAVDGTEEFEGQLEDLSLHSSISNIYGSPGTTPIQMDGFAWGARLRTKDIDSQGFNHDWTIVGDHTEFIRPHADGGSVGFYWPAPSAALYGDLMFIDLSAAGQTIASLDASTGATIFGTFNGETYLSAPYAILGEAGTGCAQIIAGSSIDHLMTEYIGNAFIADDDNFSGGTYTDSNKCRGIGATDIGIWYSSWSNGHFWGGGRGRRASIDVWSASLNIHDLTPAGGNFSPNVADPASTTPIATFNLTSILQNGIYGVRVAGDINLWLSTGDSGTVPAFLNSVITASNVGVTLAQTGAWSGAMRGWSTTGNYTTTTAGDVFEGYGNGVAPGGSGLSSLTQTIGIAMQSGLTTTGAIPLAQEGAVNIGTGYNSPGFSLWKQSTGIGTPITITAAGASGTNGSFSATATGGGCTTEPTFTFTVTGGIVTATTITNHGAGCTSAPTLPTSASSGLSGATLTAKWPSALAIQAASLADPNVLGVFVGGSGSGAQNFVLTQLHLGSGGGLGPNTNLNVSSINTSSASSFAQVVSTEYLVYWGASNTSYNVAAYGGTGNGVIDFQNGSNAEMTRFGFGANNSTTPAFCFNGSAISLCDTTGGTGVTNLTATLGSEESIATSATPVFTLTTRESYTLLSINVSTFTLPAGAAGQEKTLVFCQNSTGGYTVAPPSNVHGFMTVGATANKCSAQHFTYNSTQTAWIADAPGVTNQ